MIYRYFEVGKLLHLIALMALFTSMFFLNLTWEVYNNHLFLTWLYGYLAYFFLGVFIFAELDGRSRYQNYKRLVDQLVLYGFHKRLLATLLCSRCQRDAALAAGKITGHKQLIREHFQNKGYHWYHIFPDFVFSSPRYLFTKAFWKSTFFVPTYHSKHLKELLYV